MILKILAIVLALVGLTPAMAQTGNASEGTWKTAFYKRGFVGTYNGSWSGGEGLTLRMPVPIYFDGTKVRVWLKSNRGEPIGIARLTLAKGLNRQGEITGQPSPISFAGSPSLTIESSGKDVMSDEVAIPVSEGLWYLQQNYSMPKSIYAYDADGHFAGPADGHDLPKFENKKKGSWPSNVYRIDVFTADPRPVIACWGDSITQGAYSTPLTGNRYPELLAGLLKQPTLNLGVNGDLGTFSGGAPSTIRGLDGVGTVIFLMGINDIISGKITHPDEYVGKVKSVVAQFKQQGQKVYLGTIMPSKGYAKFDADPAKETFRLAINDWIRGDSGADGFIDFDAALRDPADPAKLQEALQDDWLHPNDAGYQKMAETAAAKLKNP